MKNNKKWYVFANNAEGTQLFMCDLTQEEFETVKRLLHSQDIDSGNVICDEGYSGCVTAIDNKGYDSKEAALKALKEDRYHSYMINSNEILLKL